MRHSIGSVVAGLLALSTQANAQAQPQFSVTDPRNFAWNQTEWSLTGENFLPNHYQSRLSLANGYGL